MWSGLVVPSSIGHSHLAVRSRRESMDGLRGLYRAKLCHPTAAPVIFDERSDGHNRSPTSAPASRMRCPMNQAVFRDAKIMD